MKKYIFDKSNRLWYELQGDYYIPCLTISESDNYYIGIGDKGIKDGSRKIARLDITILSQAASSTLIFTILIYWQVK